MSGTPFPHHVAILHFYGTDLAADRHEPRMVRIGLQIAETDLHVHEVLFFLSGLACKKPPYLRIDDDGRLIQERDHSSPSLRELKQMMACKTMSLNDIDREG